MAASLFPYKALPLSPSAGISALDGEACRDKANGRNLRKWRDSNGILRSLACVLILSFPSIAK